MTHDLLVLGGGTAGMAAARTAARAGRTVALVQDGPVGGDCTFTGCVPSKTLIEAAAAGAGFGAAISRVHETVARIAATETAGVLRGEGIDVVEGRAELAGDRTVRAGGRRLSAPRMVIATGAAPLAPPVPGLEAVPYLTSETVWQLTELPASLAVLGGGAVGCELAQAFARLGAQVSVVEALDRLLPQEEPEAGQVIAGVLAREGIEVRCGARLARASKQAGGVVLELAGGPAVRAERLLVATGRRPTTAGLDLAGAGVSVDDRGFIRTDPRMATTAAGIYAAGDVTGRLAFTHAADEMGRLAAGNALRRVRRARFAGASIPWVTFTDPEVARVGMTEAQAARVGGRVAYLPMSEVDRAVAAGRTEGFVKLIAGPRRGSGNAGGGRVLGATIVAARAGEMIHEVALVMRAGAFTGRLAQTVHAYPTWSVAVRSAAAQFFLEIGGRRARAAAE